MGSLSKLIAKQNLNSGNSPPVDPSLAATSPAASTAPQLAAPAARKVPRVPGEKLAIAEPSASRASDEIGPCPTCGCPLAWESIYRDGALKCEQCHPPPSRRIIGERWAIVTAGVEVLADGTLRGTPTHSWQPLRDCWRHSKRLRGELAGRTLDEQIVWEAQVKFEKRMSG